MMGGAPASAGAPLLWSIFVGGGAEMSLEQTAKELQDELGFRIEPRDGGAGCAVVIQDADGKDSTVQPLANRWPFRLWEHTRKMKLMLLEKDKEIAELRKRAGLGKKTEVLENGDIAIKSEPVVRTPVTNGGGEDG